MATSNVSHQFVKGLGTRYAWFHIGILVLQIVGIVLLFAPLLVAPVDAYVGLRQIGSAVAFSSMLIGVVFTLLLEMRQRIRRLFLILHLSFTIFVIVYFFLMALGTARR
jgi:hypothetical protein